MEENAKKEMLKSVIDYVKKNGTATKCEGRFNGEPAFTEYSLEMPKNNIVFATSSIFSATLENLKRLVVECGTDSRGDAYEYLLFYTESSDIWVCRASLGDVFSISDDRLEAISKILKLL